MISTARALARITRRRVVDEHALVHRADQPSRDLVGELGAARRSGCPARRRPHPLVRVRRIAEDSRRRANPRSLAGRSRRLGGETMNPNARLRILLVEDDAIFAAVTAEVMRERALVRWTPTAESAIAAAGEKDWDLIITDVELPGMSGLELVMKIKAAQPHVATLILTGHRSFDNAVEAIRVGADDFLTKPVDRRTLIEKIDELAALSARRKAASSAAVLAIGAHPDDIEVGAGGTLLGHVAQGHEVSVLVLTGGDVGGMPGRARPRGRARRRADGRAPVPRQPAPTRASARAGRRSARSRA